MLNALNNRTRLFAIPVGGGVFHEFDAFSLTQGDGVMTLEVAPTDRKYIKKARKSRVLQKIGVMFTTGQRFTAEGYFGKPLKTFTCYGETVEFDIHVLPWSTKFLEGGE